MGPAITFTPGATYSRHEISRTYGGPVEEYLPHRDGRVTAVCLKPEANPHAPIELLAGRPEHTEKWARVLSGQDGDVSVFIKEATNAWRYEGRYMVAAWTDRNEVIQALERAYNRDVSLVIYLARVGD